MRSLSTLTSARAPLSRVAGGGAGQGRLIAHGIARSWVRWCRLPLALTTTTTLLLSMNFASHGTAAIAPTNLCELHAAGQRSATARAVFLPAIAGATDSELEPALAAPVEPDGLDAAPPAPASSHVGGLAIGIASGSDRLPTGCATLVTMSTIISKSTLTSSKTSDRRCPTFASRGHARSRFRYWCRMVGIAAVAVSIAPVPAALASFGATAPVPAGSGFGDGACRGGGAGAYTREP